MPPIPDAKINVGNAPGNQLAESGSFGLTAAPSILRGPDRPVADLTLLDAFAHWARKDGSRPALVDGDTVLTYGELHQRTNQLARLLRSRGVVPGDRVGLALRRSADLVVALLASVKAGGAYVPLDPDYPAARLAQMLDRAQPRLVITLDEFAGRFPGNVLRLDADSTLVSAESADDLAPAAGPDDPLYVIFTSGSTGQPKGAVIQRCGFANLIEWFADEFAIGPADRFLLLSSPSFDLTQKNFFVPLATGSMLVCFPSGPYDLTRLADLIEHRGITVMNCTPSAFYPLIDNDRAMSQLTSLRLVVLGGEIISLPRVRAWLEHPSCRAEIANTYGPTECTDICAFHRLHRDNLGTFPGVPLSACLPNVQLAVVNDALQPCRLDEPGELLIGGAGVGLGYLGEPERTAASFIPNPLPDHLDGPVVYRTGDRAKLSEVLEYLGRLDHQVKLRGFRIELPEIEAVLASHPAVREAAVVMRGAGLEAFYLPREAVDSQELREHLSARLPDHMVPAKIIALAEFPLTPNGKVDRLALSAPDDSTLPSSTPADDLESFIRDFWTSALDRPVVGLDDNFFDLGGDSIQLATLHFRLVQLTNRDIPITDLFVHSTIRTLARHLSGENPSALPDAIRQRAAKQRQALAARRPSR